MGQGIKSGIELASYIGWRADNDNPVPTWFLAHIAGPKLPTLVLQFNMNTVNNGPNIYKDTEP
jgi:hypothetical protein